MKHIKKIIVILIALFFVAFLFIYRTYNLKKLEELKNSQNQWQNQMICSDDYNPVCGKDGETYSNECIATKINQVLIAHTWECETNKQNASHSWEIIGESNLWEIEEETNLATEEEVNYENIILAEVNDKYYENLKSQCGEDGCCLDSVDNMIKWKYSEAVNGLCPSWYNKDILKCVSSYSWCIPSKNEASSTTSSSWIISWEKIQNYSNDQVGYSFSLPYSTYYSWYGSQDGSTHSVGISTSSWNTDFASNNVKVYFYKNKILPELQDSYYGMYEDKANNKTYLKVNESSIIIEWTDKKIIDIITRTISVK